MKNNYVLIVYVLIERELDDISGAYQLALRGKQDAEHSARISDERFQKISSSGPRISQNNIGKMFYEM